MAGLLTGVDPEGSVHAHGVSPDLVREQADALGLPLEEVRPTDPSNPAYVAAWTEALRRVNAAELWIGDLFLEDVRRFREATLGPIAALRFPLWGEDTGTLVREMLEAGLTAMVVKVDLAQAPRRLLGLTLSPDFLDELPPHVDPAGERGEFHTFVTSGPGFGRPIAPRWVDVVTDDRFARCVLEPGPRRAYGDVPFELPELE